MREFEFFHELATLSGGDDIDGVIEAGRTIRSPFEEVLTTMPGKCGRPSGSWTGSLIS
jgi:hypothetical protein